MKRSEKNQTRKIIVRVHIGGKKKPVTKEAIICSKSGKIMKFLYIALAETITFNENHLLKRLFKPCNPHFSKSAIMV